MKRPWADDLESPIEEGPSDRKKRRSDGGEELQESERTDLEEGEGADLEEGEGAAPDLGEDVVREVLRRADARTLGAAACVSRAWRRMAEDERVWEAVCTRHWVGLGCPPAQLRAVVLALGGFRRLHARYLRPLLHPPSATTAAQRRHSKDELQLSLSLLSIGYFEKMKLGYPKRPTSSGR